MRTWIAFCAGVVMCNGTDEAIKGNQWSALGHMLMFGLLVGALLFTQSGTEGGEPNA